MPGQVFRRVRIGLDTYSTARIAEIDTERHRIKRAMRKRGSPRTYTVEVSASCLDRMSPAPQGATTPV